MPASALGHRSIGWRLSAEMLVSAEQDTLRRVAEKAVAVQAVQ